MRRSDKILVHVEPVVFAAIQQLISREAESNDGSVSVSSYVRKLLINHLQERGLFTVEMVAGLAV